MLLHDRRGRERGLEAVRGAGADHAAKAAQRLAAFLGVVGQRVQPVLDGERRAKPVDDPTLRAGQRERRRIGRFSAWERGPR